MSFLKCTRRFLSVVLPLALLAACGGGQGGDASSTGGLASVAVSGGGVTVDVLATQSWGGGYNGAVRISDTSFASPITSFQVVFKLSGSAGLAVPGWNGTISGPDASGNYTAKSPDWLQYQPIRAGAAWDVGFTGTGTFSGSTIVSLTINGQVIPIGGDSTPPTVSLATSAASVTTPSTITLTATASDNVGVTRVELYDGATLVATKTAAPYTQTVAFTAANNGTHAYTAKAFDAAGNSATSSAVNVVVSIGDIIPPTVSLASSATSVTTASTITLTATATDNVGVVRVEFYDGTTLLGSKTAAPWTQTVALTAANNGTHSYTAKAFDAAGSSATSSAVAVVVNIGGDNQAPTVSLASSATSVTTATTITLTATATDNVGVTRVEFYDGTTLLASDTASPWSQTVALVAANNGTHSYTAKAFDAAGNNATSAAVSVVVNIGDTQAPTVSLASSSVNVTTASTITLTATASDNVGVARVEIYDGATLLATKTATPYTQTVSLTAANNGTHSYTAKAFDAAGNNATSAIVAVVVNIGDTIPPTVTLAATPTSITTASSVTLTATASDNVGVARVEFYDGATLLVSDTAAPYQFIGGMTSANNGTHSFTAKAFDAAGNSATSTAVSVVVNIPVSGTVWRVNTGGRITKNGTVFPVHCGAWFGLQGRYEISTDSANPRGAPMEQYVGNTFWASTHNRTVMQTMNEIKAAGITVIRLPVVHQTLDANDPQGKNFLKNYSGIINDPTYPMTNSRQGLESMLKAANAAGLYVLLDIHSCSNYVDWRKGRLDARPPWVDSTRQNYDYKREDCSCASDNNPSTVTRVQAYNETIWLQDLKTLAGLGQQLGIDNIMGIDIYNEPWDYSWQEWKTLTEHAYTAINSVNPNVLLFVQGISGSHGNQLGVGSTPQPTPYSALTTKCAFASSTNCAVNPNWGENLYEASTNPINMPKDRLVFSPHTYGPSVAVQPMFMDGTQAACAGLEGDAAAAAKCNIVINPTLLKQGWDEHFGYLKALGYAVVVGEWGGNLDWPKGKASLRDQQMWSYLPAASPGVDQQWQNAFTDYMVSKGIESCYWSINPESGDTGGWYTTPYDPNTNTGGWGEWGAFDSRRNALLQKVWTGIP
jgi:hypothetical protein